MLELSIYISVIYSNIKICILHEKTKIYENKFKENTIVRYSYESMNGKLY